MSRSDVGAAIDVARELAWLPIANQPAGRTYDRRKALHAELDDRLSQIRTPQEPDELRLLVIAMRRLAKASYANRCGLPYAERRQAALQLRGALDVFDRLPGVR